MRLPTVPARRDFVQTVGAAWRLRGGLCQGVGGGCRLLSGLAVDGVGLTDIIGAS